ncbi:unnamed protein product [Lupinus luteus]|uniref:Uncharacterized protein n=1 Tax=Lupinus luteus TaxID=3873 RepID=A0AAV1WZE8_LUPLU
MAKIDWIRCPIILNMRWHWNDAYSYYKKKQTKYGVDCLSRRIRRDGVLNEFAIVEKIVR